MMASKLRIPLISSWPKLTLQSFQLGRRVLLTQLRRPLIPAYLCPPPTICCTASSLFSSQSQPPSSQNGKGGDLQQGLDGSGVNLGGGLLEKLQTDMSRHRQVEQRKIKEQDSMIIQQKRWTVNGPIRPFKSDSIYYVDPAEHEENTRFLASIRNRQLLILMGARASGKTTRLYRLMTQLTEEGYLCFMVSLQDIHVGENPDTFWTSLGYALQRNFNELRSITSSDDFLNVFARNAWKEQKKIVIFVDEFDKLYNAPDKTRDQCLQIFRSITNNNFLYAIHSIVICGTFSIRHLSSTSMRTAPFNIGELLKNPYFTSQQVHHLFKEYAWDMQIAIDPDIVDDIFSRSNGHPGLICLCGHTIEENLKMKVDPGTRSLTFDAWHDFQTEMLNKIYSYPTFRRMVDLLLSPNATTALNLLRSQFIGFLGNVPIREPEMINLADFLTAEGVLLKLDMGSYYRMSSAYVDSLIQTYVIPRKYPGAPRKPILAICKNRQINVLKVLQEVVPLFDKDLLREAPVVSYKLSKVQVDGYTENMIPRESVYNSELFRILRNWLVTRGKFKVFGQCHLHIENSHTYSDIVIMKPGLPTVVLKLVATENAIEIERLLNKTLRYKNLHSVGEAWVIHFTCEDDYSKNPHWQSDELLRKGVFLMHLWHNLEFTEVRMSARWKDMNGDVQQIDDQPLAI
ncbi:hypothetical protein L873DRAFT_1842228 [Choiromyces venosus 120613-1]|uniref:Uncharacterized protein n=1 Tax=Choiromyces venosus 120613-1 TaxID=1336337 RepID=A0A3N4JX39_9PEZI|nr:hypothetical protein L873DRAFT_1842228 [Choiromyces venosus 120613-1]